MSKINELSKYREDLEQTLKTIEWLAKEKIVTDDAHDEAKSRIKVLKDEVDGRLAAIASTN